MPRVKISERKSINELRAYQAALEHKNEELKRARAWAEALLAQYSDLYDFNCVGFFTLKGDGEILEANLTGARLLGMEPDQAVKQHFNEFVSKDYRYAFDDFLNMVFRSKGYETFETPMTSDLNEPLFVSIEAKLFDNGQECRLVVIDITAQKLAEKELRYLSMYDPLTGLHNRGYFEEEMERLERGRQFPISIMMADVDNLKETNDQAGHAAGDLLLKRVSEVLQASFRTEDIIARIGGDEFAVLLPDISEVSAGDTVKRLKGVLKKHNIEYPGPPVSLSIGLSTADKRVSLSEVLKEADKRMYHAKQKRYTSRKNGVRH